MRQDFGGGLTVLSTGPDRSRRVHKQYIEVIARTRTDGSTIPIRIVWPDARTFTIDEITDIEPFGPTINHTQTAVYTCRFGGHTTQLFHERSRKDMGPEGVIEHLRWWVWAYDKDPGAEQQVRFSQNRATIR